MQNATVLLETVDGPPNREFPLPSCATVILLTETPERGAAFDHEVRDLGYARARVVLDRPSGSAPPTFLTSTSSVEFGPFATATATSHVMVLDEAGDLLGTGSIFPPVQVEAGSKLQLRVGDLRLRAPQRDRHRARFYVPGCKWWGSTTLNSPAAA